MTPGAASLNLFGLAAMWLLVAGMVAIGIGLAAGQPRHRLLRALGFQPKRRQRRYGALLGLCAVIALAAMALLAGRIGSTLAMMVWVMAPPAVAALLDWALPRHRRRRVGRRSAQRAGTAPLAIDR